MFFQSLWDSEHLPESLGRINLSLPCGRGGGGNTLKLKQE